MKHVSDEQCQSWYRWPSWCRWLSRHRTTTDVGLAVFFALLDTATTLLGISWWPAHPGTLAWVLLGIQAAACLSLVARRRAPLAVIAVLGGFTLAVTLLISPAGALTPANMGNVWAPFATSLAAYGPFYGRRDRRVAFVMVGLLTVIVCRPWQPSVEVITSGLLRILVGPLLALYFGERHALLQSLRDRADRAERERYLLAEQARTEERARLAGEMHDVVTHRVSLMVLQAGALRMTAPDEPTRRAAEDLRVTGCQALDELRDLVGILRAHPGGDETPSTDGLAALVAESVSVGTPAELTEDGDPALASPVVGRTVYRIVRESLTNVRKHAPGTRVTVQVSYGPSQLRLTIRNTPPGRAVDASGRAVDAFGRAGDASRLAGTGSGLGIAQLRQRVELVHGTLRAGPAPGRGVLRGSHAARLRADRGIGGVSVIRVVVVDDEPMVCAHLRTILTSGGTIEVVADAQDGAAGVEAVVRTRPDVVLMDLRMPGVDGLTAIERISKLADPPAVVVLTTFDADEYVLRALRAGAAGFLVKSTPPEDLIGLVQVAAEGHTVLAPAAARRLIAASTDCRLARDRARKLAATLTEREAEVLACLGEGLSNAQIAARLYLSEATIKGYVSRTLDKLGCANRTQAGLLAHDAGLVSP